MMRTTLLRVYYALGWAAILLSLIFMLTGIWWIVGPHQGLVAQQTPALDVLTDSVHAGGVITYTIKYCVDEDLPLPITVDRLLELQPAEGLGQPVSWPVAPTIAYEITERCETKTRLLGVPLFIIPGTYHIHSISTLKVNPLREIKQTWQSNEFQIVPYSIGTGMPPHEFLPTKLPDLFKK